MNATSLYVSTCRLILQAKAEDAASWTDLFRLLPYLRQSLSCTVCGNLLIEPYTPTETNCQHHVCKSCKGGKKKLKPSCSWCKDYEKYVENVQLRILLQCYKKLCEYIRSTSIFKNLGSVNPPVNNSNTNLLDGTTPSLTSLIQEGAGFADEFRSLASGRSTYVGLLPCVVTNTASTQTNSASTPSPQPKDSFEPDRPITPSNETQDSIESPKPSNDNNSIYSVLYAGSGNKLTIKRKASEPVGSPENKTTSNLQIVVPPNRLDPHKTKVVQSPPILPPPAKKQSRGRSNGPGAVKSGCRCGNATATPGKLTCCGQRCACYTESKPCIDCKCRGCRNPHTPDGQKLVPPLDTLQKDYQLTSEQTGPQSVTLSPNEIVTTAGGAIQVVGVYTTQLHDVSSAASPVLLDANTKVTCSVNSEEENSDTYAEGNL